MMTKQKIVNRAKEFRDAIEQYFTDSEYWNRVHMPADKIKIDPNGTFERVAMMLEEFIAVNAPLMEVETTKL